MGAEVSLKVNKLTLLYWKSFFDEKTLRIFFNQSDFQIKDNVKYDYDDNDEEPHTEYKYVTSVYKVIDRLNSIGYTLKNAEKIFNDNKVDVIDYFKLDEDDEVIKRRIDKNVTFKKWSNSVKKYSQFLLKNGEDRCFFWQFKRKVALEFLKPKTFCDKIVFDSLSDDDSESYFGCLSDKFDPIYTIRLILEYCNKTDNFEVDVTELVEWGYSPFEDIKITDDIEKIIVLVEGTSDKNILEFGLKNIYPHLYNLYYFMDFEYANSKKREGGADAVSKNIRTFIASKLKAKFIAVFDNDTIGYQNKEALIKEIKNIPDNFSIMTYPHIKFAKRYPTFAPNKKIVLDNINKRACSIELYLPKQCLYDNNCKLLPIKWKSLIERNISGTNYSDYQGEIANKEEIKENFNHLKNDIEQGKKSFDLDDWKNIKEILDHIINAFN